MKGKPLKKNGMSNLIRRKRFLCKQSKSLQCRTMCNQSWKVGRLYSLPTGAAALRALSCKLEPMHVQASGAGGGVALESRKEPFRERREEALLLVPDIEVVPTVSHLVPQQQNSNLEEAEQAEAECPSDHGMIFWRLTCSNPSRHKLVRLPVAGARKLAQGDMCVTLHRSIRGQGSCYVEVEAASSEGISMPVAVFSMLQADMSLLREGMLYILVDGERAVLRFVGVREYHVQCHDAGFEPYGSGRSLPANRGSARRALCRDIKRCRSIGVFGNVVKGGHGAASWGGRGRTALCFHRPRHEEPPACFTKCASPSRFFMSPSELASIPHEEWSHCSNWELLQLLKQQGWSLRKLPPPKILKRHPLPPHTSESLEKQQLLWYLSSVTLQKSKAYMLALLSSERLFGTSLAEIHHGMSVKYYERILDGTSDGRVAQLSIEDSEPVLKLLSDVAEDPVPLPDSASRPANVRRPRQASVAEAPAAPIAPIPVAEDVQELLDMFEEASEEAHSSDTENRGFVLESPSNSENDLFAEPLASSFSRSPQLEAGLCDDISGGAAGVGDIELGKFS